MISLKGQRGFTLIELLVVIAIIGILASLVMTQVSAARARARNAGAQSDILNLGKSVDVYTTQYDRPIIVQDPRWLPNRWLDFYWCLLRNGGGSQCMHAQSFTPDGDNGLGWWMFTGDSDATGYRTLLSKTVGKNYAYIYMTSDCTYDGFNTVPLRSNYPGFLLLTSLDPDEYGSSYDNFWAGPDGQYGRGPDEAVPLPPIAPADVLDFGGGDIGNRCYYNYP